MKKNQGISLISLIITIIVIIILAAIVIFTGFGTLSKAQLADFAQQVASLNDATLNSYAKIYGNYGLDRKSRTPEQIYYQIATGNDIFGTEDTQYDVMTGYDGTQPRGDDLYNYQPIVVDKASTNLGMSLPKVRNFDNGWCITSNGQVFNASGFYDSDSDRTYFSANIYAEHQVDATDGKEDSQAELKKRAKAIAAKIIAGEEGLVTF